MKRNFVIAIMCVLLVPTFVGAQAGVAITTNSDGDFNWGFYAGGEFGVHTTTARGSAILGIDQMYEDAFSYGWRSNADSKVIDIATGLFNAYPMAYAGPFTTGPDGQLLKLSGVWVSNFPLNQAVKKVPKDCFLIQLTCSPCGGLTGAFTPPCGCSKGELYFYGQVEAGKRTVYGLKLPVISWMFPNAFDWTKRSDLFQPLGVVPYNVVRWVGDKPDNAMQLADTMINELGSGGSSPDVMAIRANRAMESGRMRPTNGGFMVVLAASDGTPYTGTFTFTMKALFDDSVYAPPQLFRGPVLTFGKTTPGKYLFTFQYGNGKTYSAPACVSEQGDDLITVKLGG
jgi:hypothetical protein